ncbi:hypothetical protein K0U27_06335 [archaeon]|nr:hypothetical protein [archaeon]
MNWSTITLLCLIGSLPLFVIAADKIHQYQTWIVPLSSVDSKDIVFLDRGSHQGSYDEIHFPSMKNITYAGENSAVVEFQSHRYSDFIQDDLSYVAMIEQDDMLIVDCKNMSKFGATFAQTYHVAVLNDVYVEFHHYDVAFPLGF